MTTQTTNAPTTRSTTTDATAYHRLMRHAPGHRWWRPLVVGLVATLLYAGVLMAAVVAAVGAALVSPDFDAAVTSLLAEQDVFDLNDPVTFATTMLAIILMLPCLLLAMRIAGRGASRTLASVTGRVRWRWLARCMATALIVFGAGYAASFVAAALHGEPFLPRFDGRHLATMMTLILLLVPLQAAAEEVVFRGFLMQAVGAWLRHPAFAIVLPVPLFVLGHDYEPLGMIDIAAFALVTGWLTWRTGGLEAAIALHVVNNCAITTLGAIGLVDVNATGLGVVDLLVSITIMLVFAAVVARIFTRERRATPATAG